MTTSGLEFALNDDGTEIAASSSITNTGSAHDKVDMAPAAEAALARHDPRDSCDTAPMSIYAVLRAECRRRLYVHPIVWTAHHLELLGAGFDAVIRLDRESTRRAQTTSDARDEQARVLKPPWCNRACLNAARSLVSRHDPDQQRAALGELLRTYGLKQVGMGMTGDRMMVSTNFDSISESRHRWVQGRESRARLYDRSDTAGYIMQGKKLKALQPAEAHQDPYIWGLLIALAQAQRRRQAAASDDAVARWRLCLLALPGAGARQLFCYRGWLPAAMLPSSTDAIDKQDDIKRHPTPPPPSLEYIPVYGEWERKRYPNWPDARFQIPAIKEHAGQVYYLRKGDLVGFGTTALVERLPSGNAIVKTPLQNPLNPAEERMNREAVAREAEVYQRLSSGDGNDMPTIPKFLGWDAQSCTLTLEHQSNGDLATYFRDNGAASGVDIETRGKWATQAARALASLHDKEVIHADVAPRNFLLNDNLDLCICDFAGSIFPGSPVETGAPGSRYQAGPWGRGYVPTKADDLFALGSVLYLIMTGNEPYIDLLDIEVEHRFQAAEFPETGSLQYGSVIDDCWHGRLTTAHAVVQALTATLYMYDSLTVLPVASWHCCVALWLAGGTLLPSQVHVTSHHLRVFRTGQVAYRPRGAPRQPGLFPSRPRAGETTRGPKTGPTKFALHVRALCDTLHNLGPLAIHDFCLMLST
ncbi:hypothetical protein G3M48_006195 [Beauveria asiatica]|uniref:EKC/KEOPS complex subunit BUD32 n=1 Tax=Beauveria asiatica TaxID=1069075 RepID=A0AAW0RPY6_9HYPO